MASDAKSTTAVAGKVLNTVKIAELLKQTAHHDKDDRYMATSDLTTELEAVEAIPDASLQLAIRNAILTQLEDTSTDVQTVAVKFLSTLVKKFHADQVVDVVDRLGQLVIDHNKKESHDIYGIGLKTIIGAVADDAAGEALSIKLLKSLVTGLKAPASGTATPGGGSAASSSAAASSGKENSDYETTIMDIIKEVFTRFGTLVAPAHGDVLSVLTPRLESKIEVVRKRASQTIGSLVGVISDPLFASLLDTVIAKMEAAAKSNAPLYLYTYIQTVGVISQSAGVRVAKYLPKIVPILETFCSETSKIQFEDADKQLELWEHCLNAFNALITRCPNEVTPYVKSIVTICLHHMKHDPNYTYPEESDDADSKMADGRNEAAPADAEPAAAADDDAGWGDDDTGADKAAPAAAVDDDDTSWKVRRAAVNVLGAFIRARSDILKDFYSTLADTFISRFKERDSHVKLAILSATCDLLREAVVSRRDAFVESKSSTLNVPVLVRTRSSFQTLDTKVRSIVNACVKQYVAGTVDTKKSVLNVIRELIIVKQGGLDEYLKSVMPHVVAGIKTDDVRLKGDALNLLHLLIDFHSQAALQPFVADAVACALSALTADYAKLKAEALRVCGALCKVLHRTETKNFNILVSTLYQAVYEQLLKKDMDSEVKEAALVTIAWIIFYFGDVLKAKLGQCWPVLLERLTNELTRLSALRAVTKIAESPLVVDLKEIASPAIQQLAAFLRKDNQQLRHETVQCLDALVRSGGTGLSADTCAGLLKEVAPHISDADLHLSRLVLDVISSILIAHPAITEQVSKVVLARVLDFLKSPMLQGQALASVVKLFQNFLQAKESSYSSLVGTLLAVVDDKLSFNQALPVAQCVAAMAKKTVTLQASASSAGSSALLKETVDGFVKTVSDAKSTPHAKMVALLTIGEIGRDTNLTAHKNLEGVVFSAFSHAVDNVQNAAAFALGNVACGAMTYYLPVVLEWIRKEDAQRYLLLQSMREIITRHSANAALSAAFQSSVDVVTPILLGENAESKDEGVRGMVAECVGRLAIINSGKIMPQLEKLVSSPHPFTRAVVVTALRFTLPPGTAGAAAATTVATTAAAASPAPNSSPVDVKTGTAAAAAAAAAVSSDSLILRDILPKFLPLLADEDLNVRRQTMLTINALAFANIELLTPVLRSTILPALYRETIPNPKLVRVIDYGPFKVNFDDGLPLRKAAFQCLETFLDVAPHRLDLKEYITEIQKGLNDHDDIQIVVYGIMYNCATWHGNALLQVIEELPPLIMASVRKKLKEANEKEPERAKDVLRSSVRALYAMHSIQGVGDMCPKFREFYARVLQTARLAKMLKEMLETA